MPNGDIPALVPDVEINPPGYPQPKVDPLTARLYEEIRPSIVQVEGTQQRLNGARRAAGGLGSGYFYDTDGTVVTDAHVVLQMREIFVSGHDGKRYRARIQNVNDVDDTAVLKLDGFKPGNSKPLESGSSFALKQDESVWAFGHPRGQREVYVSPGYYRFNSDLMSALTSQTSKLFMSNEVRAQRNNLTPAEFADYRSNMTKSLVHGMVHIEPGNSGGPLVHLAEKDGALKPQVAGVARSVMTNDFSNSYFTPVEDVDRLVRDPAKKFEFEYSNEPSPWAKHYLDNWRNNKVAAVAETTVTGGIAYGGVRLAQRFPVLKAGVGAYGLMRLAGDATDLSRSTNELDSAKYGLATASDTAMVAGTIASFIPRVRTLGKVAMALGITGSVGSEFIPNRVVLTDIRRTDGSPRPPYLAERIAHLRDFSME